MMAGYLDDWDPVVGTQVLDVYEPIAGWKVRCLAQYRNRAGEIMWDVEFTDYVAYGTREEALRRLLEVSAFEGVPVADRMEPLLEAAGLRGAVGEDEES